jgi:hypothetical protein
MTEAVDVSVPFGVSGAFLTDEKKFSVICSLSSKLSTGADRLRRIESKLTDCNRPPWLLSFKKKCLRRRQDFRTELVSLVQRLESEKAALTATIARIQADLTELGPTIPETITSLAFSHQASSRSRLMSSDSNPDVVARNAIIDGHLGERDRAICIALDETFPTPEGRPAKGLPDNWFTTYGAYTYCQAYEKCRQLVQTVISKRRRLARLP